MARELLEQLKTVAVERAGLAAWVRINRPDHYNSLYHQVHLDIAAAFDRIDELDWCRAVVITGTGDKAFCAGGDTKLDLPSLASMTSAENMAENRLAQKVIDRIRCHPLPVIARVNGVAAGGGFDMAIACDIVIAASTARFGSVWIRRGLVSTLGGAWLLPRIVGTLIAKELLLSGRIIDAAEALRLGIANRVVEPGELDAAVAAQVDEIAANPAASLAVTKQLVNQSDQQSLDTYMVVSAEYEHALSRQPEPH